MNRQVIVAGGLAAAGVLCAAVAVYNERRMQRHRQPGVTYAAATLRRDGGWRRTDLFTPDGLRHQARAAGFGFITVICWVSALAALVFLAD